jgi:hypothetical protein
MYGPKAIQEAQQRARRDKYEMHVSYYPDHPSLDPDNRYITHRADLPYAHAELTFIITPDGKVHTAHHHARQDGSGGRSWTGLKRDCPICHPEKRRSNGKD